MNNFDNCITVSALNGYIKSLMEFDDFLSSVAVRGEISNFKSNVSGHLYFSLKDEGGTVSAVMFRSAASRLSFRPCDGMKVALYGRISVYEKTGQYQIYVQTMTEDGAGELARAYEQLKRKLEGEGLFAPERKREIPKMPRRIGIVTSPTGAAVRDMINVTGRRYPVADIVLFPSAVQGAEAPAQLTAGIEYFNATGDVDVIIIGRGGGSLEDLWAFNDEGLVRAVAASEIPVISAVGHETDFTLCDFASDLRAPTPSAAAELAVPDVASLRAELARRKEELEQGIKRRIDKKREAVALLERIIKLRSPLSRLDNSRLGIIHLTSRIEGAMTAHIRDNKSTLSALSARLEAINPLAVLARGYSMIRSEEGAVLSSVTSVREGDRVDVVMSDGKLNATIDKVSFGERK